MFHDFTELAPLQVAESAFYKTKLSAQEATAELDRQLENLEELARFIVAYVTAKTADDERFLTDQQFIKGINFKKLQFSHRPESKLSELDDEDSPQYEWSLDPSAMDKFNCEFASSDSASRSRNDALQAVKV